MSNKLSCDFELCQTETEANTHKAHIENQVKNTAQLIVLNAVKKIVKPHLTFFTYSNCVFC